MLKPLDIIFLVRPSCRAIAYCGAMKRLGVYPAEVIFLPGSTPFMPELLEEDKLFGYSGRFFDLGLDPLEWCGSAGAVIKTATTDDINSDELHDLIAACSAPDLLFCASGIVGTRTLAVGKRFLHVHPGWLPDYRGSTCFYYSILERAEVAATAFVMNDGIDTGDILEQRRYSLNLSVQPEQRHFMDQILDPYLRALVLEPLLKRMRGGEAPVPFPAPASDRPPYYVMHPLLRGLAIRRLNEQYRDGLPSGLFEMP